MEDSRANILKIIKEIKEAEEEAKLIKQKGEKEAEEIKEHYKKEASLIRERSKEIVEKERTKIITEKRKSIQAVIEKVKKESDMEAKGISNYTLKDYQIRNIYEEFVSLIGRV